MLMSTTSECPYRLLAFPREITYDRNLLPSHEASAHERDHLCCNSQPRKPARL